MKLSQLASNRMDGKAGSDAASEGSAQALDSAFRVGFHWSSIQRVPVCEPQL